jgi:hypothetical protein
MLAPFQSSSAWMRWHISSAMRQRLLPVFGVHRV